MVTPSLARIQSASENTGWGRDGQQLEVGTGREGELSRALRGRWGKTGRDEGEAGGAGLQADLQGI